MIHIRLAAPTDVPQCHRLDRIVWGEEAAALSKTLLARIAAYPFGNLVAVDCESQSVVGSIWTVAGDERPIRTWWEASGEGRYLGVCNPFGEHLVGVSISVHPTWLARGLTASLVERAGEIAFAAGKQSFSFCPPIADFHRWRQVFAVDDYVRIWRLDERLFFLAEDGSNAAHFWELARGALSSHTNPREWPRLDDEMPAQARPLDSTVARMTAARIGGRRGHVGRPVPGYFKDANSGDFGVQVSWRAPAAAL